MVIVARSDTGLASIMGSVNGGANSGQQGGAKVGHWC
jgi:hypothetical protein